MRAISNAVLAALRGGPECKNIPGKAQRQQPATFGGITPLRQGNGAWAKELLGFSTRSTIGSAGCTITCLAMLLETTPTVVNERLKAVNGFEGNKVVWDRVRVAFSGVSAHYVASFTIDEVERFLPCLVQVDGAPIGAICHWVVYLGNGRILDPWFGTEGALSRYSPLGYAVVSARGAG